MKQTLGPSLSLMPNPVTIVGAQVDGKPNFLTVAWVTIAGMKPPYLLVTLNKNHFTNRGIKESGAFSVNVPSTRDAVAVDYCGLTSGARADKSSVFAVFYGKLGNAPMATECPLNFECRLTEVIDLGGSHELFVGEIVETFADEEVLGENGQPFLEKVKPLVFAWPENNYWRVGELVGPAWKIGREHPAAVDAKKEKSQRVRPSD